MKKAIAPAPDVETMIPKLLSIEELCELTQTPLSAMYHLLSRGEGPVSMKIGRNLRFDPRRVQDWLDELASVRSA